MHLEFPHLEGPWRLEFPAGITWQQYLIISLIGLALLLWFIKKVVLPMLTQPLEQRQQAISSEAAQVEQTYQETAQMRTDYQQRLQGIETETERRLNEAVGEAEELREQILAEAKENAAAVLRRAEEEVGRSRAKAMVSVRAEFVDDVIKAAQYAASRSLETPQQERLIARFVQAIVQQTGARS